MVFLYGFESTSYAQGLLLFYAQGSPLAVLRDPYRQCQGLKQGYHM